MPTNVKKIVDLIIRGDTKGAERGMDRLHKGMNGLQRTAAALGVSLSVGAFGVMVKRSLESADALAKTADKLGLTTEGLASLRYAAELTRVSSNTLDMALQRMTRRLAEAAEGGGEAKGALEELGLDAQKLARMAPDQAFAAIATAMEDVEGQSHRVRLAFKLFDSEGVSLVNTLALGEKGLQDARIEAEKLGLALDRQTARKAEDANESLRRLENAARGASIRFGVELAPAVESVADLITDSVFIDGVTDFSAGLSTAATGAADLAKWIGEVRKELGALPMDLTTLLPPGLRELAALGRAQANQGQTSVTIPISDVRPERIDPASVALNPPPPKAGGGSSGSNIQMIRRGDGTMVPLAEYQAMFSALDREGQLMARGMSEYADEVENDALVRLRGAAEMSAEVITSSNEQIEASVSAAEQAWTKAYRNMHDVTADFYEDTLSGSLNSFEDFADGILSVLRRMVAEYAAANTQMFLGGKSGSGGLLGSIFSGVSSFFGGYSTNYGGQSPAAVAATMNALPGFASGGRYSGGPMIVGERGPELLVPGSSGTVVPNHQLGGPNIEINQHIDLRGGASANPSEIMALMDQAATKAVAAVRQELRRGGSAYRLTRG